LILSGARGGATLRVGPPAPATAVGDLHGGKRVLTSAERDELRAACACALREARGGVGEIALADAYEIGRVAHASGLGVVDAIALFGEAIGELGDAVPARDALRVLAEAVSPFEEAFGDAVSHDLRAPLRSIGAFTHALQEDLADRELDARVRDHLRRVVAATARMNELIDALLALSKIARAPIAHRAVDLAAIATALFDELRRRDPDRAVDVAIAPRLVVDGDRRLLRVLLDNLLGNAWKFTAKASAARVEIGRDLIDGDRAFFVRDNGVGFDMSYADRLFAPFQRLHATSEFSGTGIGLAAARRIVDRHGGRIWAIGEPMRGATIFFTLPA
jgi:light-regulated signal transduction histidine kinase (bacteriophytochrome)